MYEYCRLHYLKGGLNYTKFNSYVRPSNIIAHRENM